MSLEQQPSQEPKPLSLADRLSEAKKKAAEKLKALEKTTVSRARSSRGHVENFKSLSVDATEYNVLKDIAFETYFKTLARDLQKNDSELPADFNAKWKDIKEAKKDLAVFDEGPSEIKADEDLCKVYETVRREITATMREWAKTLSEWFAEHADIDEAESKEVSSDIQKALSHPLFTAEYRTKHETFDDASRRAVVEFSERTGDEVQSKFYRKISDKQEERGRDRKLLREEPQSESLFIIRKLREGNTNVSNVRALITEIKALRSRPVSRPHDLDEKDVKNLYKKYLKEENLSSYHAAFLGTNANRAIEEVEELVSHLEEIERAVEAQRIFSEQCMQKVIDIIAKEFPTEEERQDALTFVKQADITMHQGVGGGWSRPSFTFRGDFRADNYASDPPPMWLMRAYKELNNAHLLKAYVTTDFEEIERRVGEDQLLRAFFKEPALGTTAASGDIIDFEVVTKEGFSTIQLKNLNKTDKGDEYTFYGYAGFDLESPSYKLREASLDAGIIVRANSVISKLEGRKFFSAFQQGSVRVLRSFFHKCAIDGLNIQSEKIPQTAGSNEYVIHIASVKLEREAKDFQSEIDMRLAAVKPTSAERLTALAEKDGVITITSIEDGVAAVAALKSVLRHYMVTERSQLQKAVESATSLTLDVKQNFERELQESQRAIADLTSKNNSLEALLTRYTNDYQKLEQEKAALLARNLQLSNAAHEATTSKAALQNKIDSAVKAAAETKIGMLEGDGQRYKILKQKLTEVELTKP